MDIHVNIVCNGRQISTKLSWDLLTFGGSSELKETLNNLRMTYVKELKDHIKSQCGNDVCNPVEVGTTPQTYVSDVDINLNFNGKTVRRDLLQISKVYDTINQYHYKRFNSSYTELFDINIYGTHFDTSLYCDKNGNNGINQISNNEEQRLFSLYRVSKLCPWNKNKLVVKCRKMFRDMSADFLENSYIHYLTLLFNSQNTEEAAKFFSMSKYYERDTYFSVGAYLHIVGGRKDLPANLYRDSMMDNLGFAVETLQKTYKCYANYPIDFRVMGVAKYLMRILDAHRLMTGKSNKALVFACESLNKQRKNGDSPHKNYINVIFEEIGLKGKASEKQVEKKLVAYVEKLAWT